MTIRQRLVFCVGVMLGLVMPLTEALAVGVDGLYETRVEVPSNATSDRAAGFSRALERVLVKVSGSRSVPQSAGLAEAIKSPDRFVEQFSYETASQLSADGPGVISLLRVRFSSTSVDQVLREANAPVWGSNRPKVVLWLVAENGGRRQLLDRDSTLALAEAVRAAAARRGLPITLPDDSMGSGMLGDIWGFFAEPVIAASGRYDAEAVVLARAYEQGTGLAGRWQLNQRGNVVSGDVQAAGPGRFADDLVDALTDTLAARYAVRSTPNVEAAAIEIDVSGVTTLRGYGAVSQYLSSLQPVQRFQTIRATPESVRFRIWLSGGFDLFAEHLALANVLLPAVHSAATPEDSFVRAYVWSGDGATPPRSEPHGSSTSPAMSAESLPIQ